MSNAIKPEHYNRLNPQPKDVIRAWGLNFNLGSAVKYISRAGHKDDIVQDLKKAQEFIQFEIDAIEGARAERKDKPKHEDFMDAMLRGLFGGSVGHIEITGKPHPQMLEVTVPLLKELRERVPVVFDDLEPMEWETVK